MIANVVISFHDRRLTTSSDPWIGLANWSQLLKDGALGGAFTLTLVYTVVTVTVSVLLGLSLALFFIDRPMLRRIVGTLVILPLATSLVVASVSWKLLFDFYGAFNEVLGWLGIGAVSWLDVPFTGKVVIIVVGIWAQTGFALLLYQAGLSRVPSTTLDAARLFAVWRGLTWKVRLIVPLLARSTIVVVVVSTIVALQSFDQIYALTQGGPAGATTNLSYLSYELSFNFFNLGEGAAASTLLVALVVLVVGLQFLLLRRHRSEGAS